MSKKTNEAKLVRNARDIVKKYMDVNDSLLESIVEQNKDKFNSLASELSQDNFLGGIMSEYPIFSDELMNVIAQENASRIRQLQMAKKVKKTTFVITPKRKAKPKYTLQKPGKLKSKKGKYNRWTKQEENRIKTLIKANKKPKEIIKEINTNRVKNNLVLRTESSVKTKYYRLRKNK